MATEHTLVGNIVRQYGHLAFHGPGLERVAIPEPPIRKSSGDDLPQPSEEAKRAYQILFLNKLPCLPSRSNPQVHKNEGNLNVIIQHPIMSKEGAVTGNGVPGKEIEHLPPSPKGEQPFRFGRKHLENILHASSIVAINKNERMYATASVNLEWVDASDDPEWQREDFPWSKEAERLNREVFGNQSFRYHQLSIINATMEGRDVFVLMPTGGGKSLCYQLPSVLPHGHNRLKKLTVVISPLISLMQDQAFHLEQLGLRAINLGAGASDMWKVSAEVEAGEVQVMFLTPEKLTKSFHAQSTIRKLAQQDLLARIVIDEAHCVSQWGHGKSCYIFL
jgi:hypothetical protein